MDEIKEMLSGGVRNFIYSSMPGKALPECDSAQMSKHKKIEFFFVIRGESQFHMDNKTYDTRPGDLCVIDSWVTHSFGYEKKDHDLLHLWLHCEMNHLKGRIIQVKDQGVFKTYLPNIIFPSSVFDLLRMRWQLLKKAGPVTADSLHKILRMPLNLILDEMLLQLEQKQNLKKKDDKATVVESVKQFIKLRQGRLCSLTDIETYTGYNRYYVSHLFKGKTGMSIGEYINDIRARYTVDAEQHGIKHTEIARQLGFSSIQSFGLWSRNNRQKIDEIRNQMLADSSEKKQNTPDSRL